MPKVVDHSQRRVEIIEAASRVIVRSGLNGMTIREVAREAGVSNGVIDHYFDSRDDIVISVHRRAYAQVAERWARKLDGRSGLDALRLLLLEALPLDEERHREARLDMSYWAAAVASPALNDVRRQSIAEARRWWSRLLGEGRLEGRIRTRVSDDVILDEIQILIDALSLQAVMNPDDMPPERQLALAESLLARLVQSS
ncbi:hypothetical protein BJF84_04490 [Rhodococcus sp. CUA-806]|nr:hypothetical protein BJF84_04490 [Rhodococcus sp. CUA-806]